MAQSACISSPGLVSKRRLTRRLGASGARIVRMYCARIVRPPEKPFLVQDAAHGLAIAADTPCNLPGPVTVLTEIEDLPALLRRQVRRPRLPLPAGRFRFLLVGRIVVH